MSLADPDQPRREERGQHVVAYSIDVDAPAAELWETAANPHRHHELDGSGTVRNTARGTERLSEGDVFSVRMRKFGLRYALRLRITESRPPRSDGVGVVEWRQPTGHRWRWEFAPHDGDPQAGGARVTECYDASAQLRPVRAMLHRLGVEAENARSIRASLRRLRGQFTEGPD